MKKIKFQVSTEQKVLFNNWEKYRGNIVMVVGDEIFATKRAKNVPKIIREIEDKYHKQPLITYIPKEGTLILSPWFFIQQLCAASFRKTGIFRNL